MPTLTIFSVFFLQQFLSSYLKDLARASIVHWEKTGSYIKENNNSLSCASCGDLNTWRNLRNTYFRAVFRRQDSEEDERAVSAVENLPAFAPEKFSKY